MISNHINTITDMNHSYFGNFFWFAGVVESISDPLSQGRVQARCIGIHPDNKTLVPTSSLPWAHVMLPTTSAGVSGVGSTHGLLEGSWVVGFFSDGREAQQPIIMGTIAGNPSPSPAQQNLINQNQSISTTPADGTAGLTQSTSVNNAGNVLNSALGIMSSFGTPGVDLSSVSSLLASGINPFNILAGNSPQTQSVLAAISTSNDLRVAQLSVSISDNLRVQSSPEEGRNILSYISKYNGNTNFQNSIFSSVTPTVNPNINLNPNTGIVDVQTNYASALKSSSEMAGMISIEHNSVRKSQAVAPVLKYPNLDQYHFAITAQGQVFPQKAVSVPIEKGDGLATVTARGATGTSIRICMIGGLPDDAARDSTASFQERFTIAQFNAAVRLIRVLLKKYPGAVIEGGNSIINDASVSSPAFDVTTMMKDIFPNNINVSVTGQPKILPTTFTPTSALTPANTIVDNSSSVYVENRGFQDTRGIYPAPNYGQDHNSMARYNSLTGAKRIPPVIEAIRGNMSKFHLQEPRDASNRTAVSNPEPSQIKHVDWAGEYGMSHVIRETPGGHAIYADDTPGKNRLLIVSPTGSVIDMRPDGGIAIMSHGDQYQLTEGTLNTVSNGGSTEIVNGTKKMVVGGDFILEVGGKFSIHAKELNEFIVGDRSSLVEGTSKQQAKGGFNIEVGRDYSEEIGGNRQSVTSGSVVDQAGQSRSTTTTGTSSIKSNYAIDTTLGNRVTTTRGNNQQSTKGFFTNYSEGNMSSSTSGDHAVTATGKVMQHSGGNQELNSGGLMSIIASGQMGLNAASALSLDASQIKMQEGTLAEATSKATLIPFVYPEKIQPIATMMNSETNPSAVDSTYGPRQEDEAHDEPEGSGADTTTGTDTGTADDSTSPTASPTNLDPQSLGAKAGSGCEVAKKLVARGMTEEAASAYAGAFMQESKFDPTIKNGIGAIGLAQWTSYGGRKEYMLQWTNNELTVDKQLDFVMHELKENPRGDAGDAATTWQTNNLSDAIKSAAYYERFNGFKSAKQGVFQGSEWGSRAGYAASIYKECFGKDPGKFTPAANYTPTDTGLDNNSTTTTDSTTTSPNTGIGAEPSSRGDEKNVDLPPASTQYTNRGQKISEFFTLNDLLRSGTNTFDILPYFDTPSGRLSGDEVVANLSKLAVNVLDVIQRNMGRVTVTSGLRPMWYNNNLRKRGRGAARNSQHQYGRAADIKVAGHSPSEVARWVQANIPACHGIGRYSTFTHVDVRPGGRATWGG